VLVITKENIDSLGKSDQRRLSAIIHKLGTEDMSRIKIKLLNENCMPEKAHRWDAGWDLKTTETLTIKAGETVKVHTGTIFEIPSRHCGMVIARSGLGTKHSVTLANDVGVIDSEYRGEILVFLSNDSDKDFTIKQFDRFAQMVIVPINTQTLWAVDVLSTTGRGSGGFGSSGLSELDQKVEILDDLVDKELSKLIELSDLPLSDYMKLKNKGTLKELYPESTGNMKEDLNG